ncbi:PAS domain-containing protein [Aquabacter sp. L1I39]|nr:PAS domain-containing protein [Aquabacter sp. L1I39]
MAARMRAHDWAATALGDPRRWPDGLKIPLRMLLTSRFEMWLGWGEDLCFFYNDSYIPTLGLKHPTMLGRPFREVWAEVYEDVADQVARVRDGEATWNDALLLLLERSGFPEETYHSFSYSPLFGPAGAVDGLLCVVTEVTERVIAERRLGSLRMLGMELVGATTQEAVCDAARTVLGANPRDFPFALIFLRTEEGWRGVACAEAAEPLLHHPWPLEGLAAPWRIIDLPADLPRPGGAWDIAPTRALVVSIAGASEEGVAGHLVLGLNPYLRSDMDVIDLGRLLAGQISGALANVAALTAERRRADRIWSHSRDLLVTITADGIFRSVSPSWSRILGHAPEVVVGRSFSQFMLPEDVPGSASALQRAAGGEDLTAFENRFLAVDGTLRWISWHTAREDGLVYGYGRDITEQKANAEALLHAEDALRHAQKMEAVGQLTGGIAHDFNNLLTGITGSLDMIRRRRERDAGADIATYLGIIGASADRAASLTQRLLAFSRRQALDPRPVEVMALVRGMEALIRRSIGELITLDLQAPDDLWPATCDPNQLESAILNLAINARDAMPQGGHMSISAGNMRVEAEQCRRYRLAQPGDYVAIAVSDTGHGMSAQTMAKAFDPFFTTKPLGKGTGLGLSMIYGFAQQSGGSTCIESAPGAGTKMMLFLPRSLIPARADPAEPALSPRNGGHTARVLVVEDEPAVRSLVVEALSEVGYRVMEAADGPSALAILKSESAIDLMVTDVGLPGMHGRQLADEGRVLWPGLKVLFVTGYAHELDLGQGARNPGTELLTKPFELPVLLDRVESMIADPAGAPADGRPVRAAGRSGTGLS